MPNAVREVGVERGLKQYLAGRVGSYPLVAKRSHTPCQGSQLARGDTSEELNVRSAMDGTPGAAGTDLSEGFGEEECGVC